MSKGETATQSKFRFTIHFRSPYLNWKEGLGKTETKSICTEQEASFTLCHFKTVQTYTDIIALVLTCKVKRLFISGAIMEWRNLCNGGVMVAIEQLTIPKPQSVLLGSPANTFFCLSFSLSLWCIARNSKEAAREECISGTCLHSNRHERSCPKGSSEAGQPLC